MASEDLSDKSTELSLPEKRDKTRKDVKKRLNELTNEVDEWDAISKRMKRDSGLSSSTIKDKVQKDFSGVPEFLSGTNVLAVYPGTVALHKATVVSNPSQSETEDYLLEFDNDKEDGASPQRTVHFHRVFQFPEGNAAPNLLESLGLPISNNWYKRAFQEIRKLGSGAYGHVYKCKSVIDEKLYAIKRLPFDPKKADKLMREVKMHSLFMHENIVQYFQAWIEERENDGRSSEDELEGSHILFLQMECCQGSLDDELGKIDKERALKYFRQIVCGLDHIHGKGVIHRDLSTLNILVDSSNIIKICDFGVAKFGSKDAPADLSFVGVGQHLYKAPETEDKSSKITPMADIYSLGVILFNLLYPTDDQLELMPILNNILEDGYCLEMYIGEREVCDHLRRMLSKDPSSRPSTKEILKLFPWNIYEEKKQDSAAGT